MRVVMISCQAYRDAWSPFTALLNRFWPTCPYPFEIIYDDDTFSAGASWCRVLTRYARQCQEEILLFQEDFFLTAPVRGDLVEYALGQYHDRGAGCVRLYPCPGANEDYDDKHFGKVSRGTRYRISCQASIWRPQFLAAIATGLNTPSDFEIKGSMYADMYRPEDVLAFKRESGPWPLEYLCSAISRGKWEPDAKRLCDKHGIQADWSRGFAVA